MSQAWVWTQGLDSIDNQLGILYRLAWVEKLAAGVPLITPSLIIGADVLKWPQSAEHWRDELRDSHRNSKCNLSEAENGVRWGAISKPILDDILSSQMSGAMSGRTKMREVLLGYGIYQISLNGLVRAPVPIMRAPPQVILSESEQCRWEGFTALINKASTDDFVWLLKRCRSDRDRLWSMVKLETADGFLRSQNPALALPLYREVLDWFVSREVPEELLYRIGVSAFASPGAHDQALRAVHTLLERQSTLNGQHIPPIFLGALKGLACERLARLAPGDAAKLFARVFRSDVLVSRALAMHRSCTRGQLGGVLHVLLSESKDHHTRVLLLEALLEWSLQRGDAPAAKDYAKRLSRHSQQGSRLASFAFWRAVGRSPDAVQPIKVYRRLSQWAARDERAFARWQRAVQNSPEPSLLDLKREESVDSEFIQFPLAFQVPPFSWPDSDVVDFKIAFETDLNGFLSSLKTEGSLQP